MKSNFIFIQKVLYWGKKNKKEKTLNKKEKTLNKKEKTCTQTAWWT